MILVIYPSMHAGNAGKDIDPELDLTPDEKVVPFGALSVASTLAAGGLPVNLIDCRFHTKQEIWNRIETALPETTAIGFSVMTVQIPHALELTNRIKQAHPQIPVVWGGIHPTLFPDETLAYRSIDYVIEGEAAENIVLLARHIHSGQGVLPAIPGLGYKTEGKPCRNPPAAAADVNLLPPLNYALLDIELYTRRRLLDATEVRGIDMLTSRGCPYRCTFCVNASLFHRKWRPLDSARVIETIQTLVSRYSLTHLWFADDYLFASKRRVIEILSALRESGIKITWEANIRANNFGENKIDDETLALMKETGCTALTMGFESGADRVLDFYKKDIHVADIFHAVGKCKQFGFYVKGFFIMGTPGETNREIFATFNLIYKLTELYDRYIPNAPGIYRPYPGGELYSFTISNYPFRVPSTLEEWAEACASTGYVDPRNFPWIKNLSMLYDLRFYGRLLAGQAKGVFDKPRHLPVRLLVQLVKLRFRYSFWGIRIEARGFYFAYNLLKRHYTILKWLRIPFHM